MSAEPRGRGACRARRSLPLAAWALCCAALSAAPAWAQDPAGGPAEPPPAEVLGDPAVTPPSPGAPTGPAPGAPVGAPVTEPGEGTREPPPLTGGAAAPIDGAPAPLGDGAPRGGPVTDAGPLPVGGGAPTTGKNVAAAPFGEEEASADEGLGALLWVGLGGALIAAAVGVALWGRGQGGRGSAAPVGAAGSAATAARGALRPAPEPGLLHPALPSPSDGLAAWVAPAALHEGLTAALLDALADRRRVLVVAPVASTLPLVQGGPVYRVEGLRPAQLGAAAAALRAGGAERVCALIIGVDAAEVAAFADALPSGCGGVALLSAAPGGGLPVVEVQGGPGGALRLGLRGGALSARIVGGRLQVDAA
ncbi:MAG: hypothetical protein JNM72_28490 [Deltaproteobacteria bacterium]|nr:hypothetical protein [Deltaproteobacteria bacterium]